MLCFTLCTVHHEIYCKCTMKVDSGLYLAGEPDSGGESDGHGDEGLSWKAVIASEGHRAKGD